MHMQTFEILLEMAGGICFSDIGVCVERNKYPFISNERTRCSLCKYRWLRLASNIDKLSPIQNLVCLESSNDYYSNLHHHCSF